MFALFKSKNPYEQDARRVYAAILEHIRQPVFYTDYGVPDTLDGRFDMMALHMFMVMDRALAEAPGGADFNQALFDVTFADMDQNLRESGIGDVGIPKHMRRMMKGFNGRLHAYNRSLADDAALEATLVRNVYGTLETPEFEKVKKMKAYVQASRDMLKARSFEDLMAGHLTLPQA